MVDRDELLRRTDLGALLDTLSPAPPTRIGAGARWRCIDPTHADTHPSVTMRVDPAGIGRWRCWSGGHGGTAIDALIVATGVSVADAIATLSRDAHLEPHHRPRPPSRPRPNRTPGSSPTSGPARRSCGPAPAERSSITSPPNAASTPRCCGPTMSAPTPGPACCAERRASPGAGPPPPSRPSTAPVATPTSRPATSTPPRGAPSTTTPPAVSPSTPAWPGPSRPQQRAGPLVVCEGIPDALTAATAGLAAVAVLGAAAPSPDLAARLAAGAAGRPVVLAFDADPAGRTATDRLTGLLAGHDITPTVLLLPEGADLNRHARTNPHWADALTPVPAGPELAERPADIGPVGVGGPWRGRVLERTLS